MFERQMLSGWGDMDFNSHMRNTAYLDKSADVRMADAQSDASSSVGAANLMDVLPSTDDLRPRVLSCDRS